MAEWMTIGLEKAMRSYGGFPMIQLDLELGVLGVVPYFEVLGADDTVKSQHHLDDLPEDALANWVTRTADTVVVPGFVDPARFQRALAPALAEASKRLAGESTDKVIVYAPFAWTLGKYDMDRCELKVSNLTMSDRRTRQAVWEALGDGEPDTLFERLPRKLVRKIDSYIEPRMSGAHRAFLVALDELARREENAVTLEDNPLVNEVSPGKSGFLPVSRARDSRKARNSFEKALEDARSSVGDEKRSTYLWKMLAQLSNKLAVPEPGARAHAVAADIYEALGNEAQRDAHRGWAARLQEEVES